MDSERTILFRTIVAFLIAVLAVPASAAETAQEAATIAGSVRDAETSGPLAGAIVSLPDLERAVASDAEGRYLLRDVSPGPHHISVRFIGYAQRTLHAIVPRSGQLEINISLRPQPMRLPSVEVRAPVVIRGLEPTDSAAFPEREISAAALRNHPLLAEPDVFQALGGGDIVLNPESPSGIHIRGGAPDQTAYLLDGIPVFSPFHAAGVSSAWNPDALSRLRVAVSTPSPVHANALSGAIDAVTRTPGDLLRGQGTFSTTQTRLTLDGPLGGSGAGYLVSLRSGFAGLIHHKNEASHLKGETGDVLAKVEAPALGGRVRVLGYDSENQVDALAVAGAENAPGQIPPRNVFEWHSRSLGAEWKRAFSKGSLRVLGWSSFGDAASKWDAEPAPVRLAAERQDEGLLADVELRSGRASTTAGIRVEQSRTSYRVQSDSAATLIWQLSARTPVATGFVGHERPIGEHLELKLEASLAGTEGDLYPGPRAQLRWNVSDRLALAGSYAQTHQFAQSLRNAESVVGSIFPVDLYMGSGASGIPVARSDHGVIAADYRPFPAARFMLQAYERRSSGLLLVAPRDGEPFATGAFVVGTGASRGVSLDAAFAAPRYAILASYGLQRVRFDYGDSSYIPESGARHLVEGGMILFPTATTSVRVGGTAAFRRRSTTVPGTLEWEACNLLDEGCEFGGSPHYGNEPLGATKLPYYLRIDVGFRQHWHLELGGRDVMVALFGTVANVLGRKNVLTYAQDPSTGQLVAVEMRPRAPLVLGLDLRF